MMKIVLVLALCAAAYAGYAHGGHGGYGHGAGGYGGLGGGLGGGYGGQGGWGWRQYVGWANVNAHQTPYNYHFGVQENGKGYSKWVSQGADTHHVTPVYGQGWGWSG